MVFLESKNLIWNSILQAYFNKKFPSILEKFLDFTLKLARKSLDCSLAFIRKYGSFPMQYSENQLVSQFLKIISFYL